VVHELIAGVDRPTVVCSGSLRARVVYLSQSNSIVIETFGGAPAHSDDVTTPRHADDMTRFLLQYQGKDFVTFRAACPDAATALCGSQSVSHIVALKVMPQVGLHYTSRDNAVADQGFGKGGCPIHQKGAPEGPKARAGGGSGASPENLKI